MLWYFSFSHDWNWDNELIAETTLKVQRRCRRRHRLSNSNDVDVKWAWNGRSIVLMTTAAWVLLGSVPSRAKKLLMKGEIFFSINVLCLRDVLTEAPMVPRLCSDEHNDLFQTRVVVAQWPRELDVLGSNPAGCWAYIHSLSVVSHFSSSVCEKKASTYREWMTNWAAWGKTG